MERWRAVEGARLESVYTATYRGFESLSLRQILAMNRLTRDKQMKIKIIFGLLLSIPAFADGYYPEPISEDQPWSVSASIGGGKYHLYSKTSKHGLGRLALGNEMVLTGALAWGLELGLQNGNKLNFDIPTETLAMLQWLPVNTTLGPMLDLLITAKSDPLAGSALFAQIKGGVAYRSWQVENKTINNLSLLTGEIQAGVGYPLTTITNLNLLYQGVFGTDPDFMVFTPTRSVHVANMPTLHSILFGLSVNI